MRKAVSLFSGAGGFCDGVRLAGFKVVCAVEMDAAASKTHAANFKNVALFDNDITRFPRDRRDGVRGRTALVRARKEAWTVKASSGPKQKHQQP